MIVYRKEVSFLSCSRSGKKLKLLESKISNDYSSIAAGPSLDTLLLSHVFAVGFSHSLIRSIMPDLSFDTVTLNLRLINPKQFSLQYVAEITSK